jgi:hypothetical protein
MGAAKLQGVKLHTLVTLRRNYPTVVIVTQGRRRVTRRRAD